MQIFLSKKDYISFSFAFTNLFMIHFVLYELYPFTCCLYSSVLHNMRVKPTHHSKYLFICIQIGYKDKNDIFLHSRSFIENFEEVVKCIT